MRRPSKQMFAFLPSIVPANIDPSEGVIREPLDRSLVHDPAQIVAWGKGRINAAAWSPADDLFAVGTALGIAIYNTRLIAPISYLAAATPIRQVGFLEAGVLIVTAADDAVRVWNVNDAAPPQIVISHAQAPVGVALSNDAELLAVDTGAAINIYRVRDGAPQGSLPTASIGTAGSMAFAPDTRSLIVATGESVQRWQLDPPALLGTIGADSDQIDTLALSVDGQTLATASEREIRLWNAQDGALLRVIAGNLSRIRRIAISPDGHMLAAAAQSGIHLWRVADGMLLRVFAFQPAQICSLAFDPAGQHLLAAAGDALQIWRVQDGIESYSLYGHWDSITSVAIAADGETFAAMADEVTLWRRLAGTDTLLHSFPVARCAGSASGLAFSPQSDYLALATDTQIQIRRVDDGSLLALLDGGLAQGDGLVFSEDGERLLAVSPDALQIWRTSDGALLHKLNLCTAGTYAITPAPDAQTLATLSDQAIQVWRVDDQQLLEQLSITQDINGIALARGGRMLAAASDDAIQLWQLDPARPSKQCFTIEGRAQRLLFSENGDLLASAWDATVQLWSVHNGALLHTFTGHTDTVHSIAFSQDSCQLLTGSHDGTVRLWQCVPEIG